MASMALSKFVLPLVLVFIFTGSIDAHIEIGYYSDTCPNAEAIVHKEMAKVISVAPSLAGPLLRMHFHDCFVRGCDASILLNSTKNDFVEKDAPPNLSLRGFGVIDRIKAKLEEACPGTVSCADILALVARDSVVLTGGPFYEVPTGRQDGNRSVALDILGNLPPPTSNITELKLFFQQKNLTMKDLVVLSGAHTIGTSHCSSFSDRLYNFTGKRDTDPSIDKYYVPKLKSKCKPNDLTTLAEMDPGSSRTFDLGYYKVVSKRRGLFVSDDALLHDPETKAYVERQAKGSPYEFFKDFGESMVKMGMIEVLTHKKGEIRKKCAFVN